MQPLSRVRPRTTVSWGESDIIPSRPRVAVKIAQCIALWAEIETMLGLTIALLLDTDSKAAMAMYSSVENRTAQRRMILAASQAKLPPAHHDVLKVLFNAVVSPAMKQRDKLAHWCWGRSDDFPNDLLLSAPSQKMAVHFAAAHSTQEPIRDEGEEVFVVTEQYLERFSTELTRANRLIAEFAATVWMKNTPAERATHLQKLSNEPRIREALARLNGNHKNNQEAQPPSPR